MKNFTTKSWGLLGIGLIGFVVLGLSFSKPFVQKQKCPDDYADTDAGSKELMAAVDSWTNAFYDAHPGASLSDWSAARHQFWVDNNCTAALERYEAAKNDKADPETMIKMESGVREAVTEPSQ